MLRVALQLLLLFQINSLSLAEDIPKRHLPEGTVKVVGYLYDYSATDSHRTLDAYMIEAQGKLHPGVIQKFTKVISEEDTQILLDAFTEKHPPRPRPLCEPAPHHAFVFYDKGDKILGSVSVCFQCSAIYSRNFAAHVRDPLNSFWDWQAIRNLFMRNGFPILKNDADYTTLRKNQEGEQVGADQPATRPESKLEGSQKPQPESEVRPR